MAANPAHSHALHIAVLAGGNSAEREISLRSGRAAALALRGRGHQVTTIDPAEFPPEAAQFRDVDAAFLALHGRNGEDGRIQKLLDRMGVLYPGSGAEASELAFSKSATKERLFQRGLPTPEYALIHQSDDPNRISELACRVGYPLVVKPDGQGSSLGVHLVESPELLASAAGDCFRHDTFGLLERAVLGTEWTLGLIDDDPLPLIQIETTGPIFDFNAKYDDDRTIYRFDFSVGDDVIAAIVETGRSAARAVGTKGLTRVDLRLDAENRPSVLEVNTIPGLTEHSLLPMAAARAGISLGELCERSIERCLSATASRRPLLHGPHWTRVWRAEPKRG